MNCQSAAALGNLPRQEQNAENQCGQSKPKWPFFLPGNGSADKENEKKQELHLDDSDNDHSSSISNRWLTQQSTV
jgi:hypothetical protein